MYATTIRRKNAISRKRYLLNKRYNNPDDCQFELPHLIFEKLAKNDTHVLLQVSLRLKRLEKGRN